MAKRVIKGKLSVSGIENIKKELLSYKENDLPRLLDLFVQRLAEVGIPVIEQRMNEASISYEDSGVEVGADPSHLAVVKVNSFGDYARARLIVSGKDLFFIEFGAGTSYNGDVGSSPHPKGEEFGFTIGSYGKGYGARKVWGYYADSGELVLTRGVKATMPVYSAEMEIISSVLKVAREVFR